MQNVNQQVNVNFRKTAISRVVGNNREHKESSKNVEFVCLFVLLLTLLVLYHGFCNRERFV